MGYLEMLTYAAWICIECLCCVGRNDRLPTPPPSPQIKHYNLNEDLEPCPREIPKDIDWEVVNHDD